MNGEAGSGDSAPAARIGRAAAPVKRLYHSDMYRFGRAEPSLWEARADPAMAPDGPLHGDRRAEVAVIGGGYTGLSAALHLARDHGIEARVLEAGHFGWGASGRNAGFCSIGGTSLSLEQMLARYGEDETRAYYRSQLEAIELVRRLIADEGIDAEPCGEAELEAAPSRRAFEHLRRRAEAQRRLCGIDSQVLDAQAFRARYFGSTELAGGVVQRPAFAIQPLRYLHGLARAARRAGAVLHPHSEVLEWRRENREHLLLTAGGTLRARHVILAANGFMPEHLHAGFSGRPLPMISAIIVTRPLAEDELAAAGWRTSNPAISARHILNYYRLLPDRRFLFGGRGHSSGAEAGSRATFAALHRRLGRLWPAWREIPVEYRWHGLICISRRLTPSVGRLANDPSVAYAWGYHGNGVNTATWCGRMLAAWLAREPKSCAWPAALPAVYRGLPPHFPLPGLRLRYLQARLAVFRLQDALA